MKFFIFSLILFIIFSCSNLYSQTLSITNIEKQDDFINIEFNKVLEVYNLKLNFIKETYSIVVPKYKSNSSTYNYFSFLNKSFKEEVINSINKNTIKEHNETTSTDITYKINKFNIINSKTLKATFSVIFNDLFETNATIMNGKNGLWVQWPSIKQQDNSWKKLFIIKDKTLKNAIEKDILNKYNKDILNDKYKK